MFSCFNVSNNTVLVLLVSSSSSSTSSVAEDPSDSMSDSRVFTVEFRVSIDNFLECRAKPVVLVVIVQEGLEES